MSQVAQVNYRREGQMQAHKKLQGLWHALLWLRSLLTGIHMTVEAKVRGQTRGVQMHS